MPELPEVETVVIGLNRLLGGHSIIGLSYDWPKSYPNSQPDTDRFVIGATVTSVRRRAKVVIIDLDSGYSLLVHLKMTGQLVYVDSQLGDAGLFGAGHPSDSLLGDLPDKTTRVTIGLSGDAKLFFNDVRKFGWVKLLPTGLIEGEPFIKRLGPDALDISVQDFVQAMSSKRRSIKSCLLDQSIVAGCGNIYADESLWMSRLHPSSIPAGLTTEQLGALHNNLVQVLRLSIEKGGSSNRNYVNAEGQKGSYLSFANVYQRTAQPCNRCSEPIIRLVVAGRGTHICPQCQVLGAEGQ